MKVKKILKTITAVVLSAVSCFFVVSCDTAATAKPNEEMQEVFYDGFLAEEKESNGLALRMRKEPQKANAAASYTITATVTGEGNFNDTLTWEASFKNPSSTWASGKTVGNYVTLAPSGDTLSVVVSNSAAFGEPIIVKATSVDNPTVSATCQLDYVKRIDTLSSATLTHDDPKGIGCGIVVNDVDAESMISSHFSVKVNFGVGTITPEVYMDRDETYFSGSSPSFDDLLTEINETYDIELSYGGGNGPGVAFQESTFDGQTLRLDITYDPSDFGFTDYEDHPSYNAAYNYFMENADGELGKFHYGIYSFYAGGMVNMVTGSLDNADLCTCYMSRRASVSNVAFNKSNLVF